MAVLLTTISACFFIRSLAKPLTGLVVNFPEVVPAEGGVLFAPKTPFSPALSSGLKPFHDLILRIGETRISSVWDVVAAERRIWRLDPIPVEVLRDGVERMVLSLHPAFAPFRPDWVFALLFSLSLGFTAFTLILQLPEDEASRYIALAALFYLLFTCVKPFYYESFLANLLIHFGKLTSWLMAFFALSFPQPKVSRRARAVLLAVIPAAYLVFTVARLACYLHWSSGGGDAWFARYRYLGQWSNVSDGVAFLLYGLLLLHTWLRTRAPGVRIQIEWILAGFVIAIPPYFLLDQLPLILGEPPGLRISMGNFANLFLAPVPIFFTIGLVRHRALNIRFFFSRYLVYVILAFILFAFFCLLYEPLQSLFNRHYGLSGQVGGFLVTAVLFALLLPLRSLLIHWIEKLFYPGHYRRSRYYAAALETKNRELLLIIDELNRQALRTLQSRKLRDLKGILAGISGRMNRPVERVRERLRTLERKLDSLLTFNGRESAGGAQSERELRTLLVSTQMEVRSIQGFLNKLDALTGSPSGPPTPVPIRGVLTEAADQVQKRYPGLRIKVIGDQSILLSAIPGEMPKAIGFLLENAAEASAAGLDDVLIRIREEGTWARLEIEDHGIGIDELTLKHIWDPFFTTKDRHEGLGLFFCRTILERNLGSLEVKSSPETGTTVFLSLLRASR